MTYTLYVIKAAPFASRSTISAIHFSSNHSNPTPSTSTIASNFRQGRSCAPQARSLSFPFSFVIHMVKFYLSLLRSKFFSGVNFILGQLLAVRVRSTKTCAHQVQSCTYVAALSGRRTATINIGCLCVNQSQIAQLWT